MKNRMKYWMSIGALGLHGFVSIRVIEPIARLLDGARCDNRVTRPCFSGFVLMCTYAFHFDPSAQWPFVIAGNRDEMTARPWSAPAGHWPDRPGVIAGLDQTAGGSWAGMNDDGVIACILNRWDTLGPAEGKRSRGEIVLDALDFADAADAADALSALAPEAYRGFNLVVADNRDCFWLRCVEGQNVEVHTVSAGTHLISHGDLDDLSTRRIERYLPKFQTLGAPQNPDGPIAWDEWRALLNDGLWTQATIPRARCGLICRMLASAPAAKALWLFERCQHGSRD